LKHYDIGNPKPEIVIGLAGPVGTDLRSVATTLAKELRTYKYHSVQVRVSDLIKEWCSDEVREYLDGAKEDERINGLMNAGDDLRNKIRNGAALIPLVTTAIRHYRQSILRKEGCEKDHDEVELYNHCFIINSLKHPDEVNVLRKLYGQKFIMVSSLIPQEERRINLCSKIARSHGKTDGALFREKADQLIEKDKSRRGYKFGQNISGAFPLADFFLRGGDAAREDARRLLKILFGHPNVTPTKNEFVMFEARSNALRSADLSRQVGAVITNDRMEIVSRGCNEVPIAGGDTYWPDEEGHNVKDNRDYAEGRDYNAVKKNEILLELVHFLLNDKFVCAEAGNSSSDPVDLAERVLDNIADSQSSGRFKDLRITNLIEFGRMVHAEMFALMEAARRGLAVDGGRLYCTTFPCHMCARHIIAAGIREVVYIEPYPKSMTQDLYKDIVVIDAPHREVVASRSKKRPSKVYFQAFHGTAPRIYGVSFEMPPRKNGEGYIFEYKEDVAQPKWINLSKSHLSVECAFSATLSDLPFVSDLTYIIEE